MQRQNVLLVLTGDARYLSAPITFNTLQSESLPLAREDIPSLVKLSDVIRVPLIIAKLIILDLQRREEAASLSSGAPGAGNDH